MDIAAQKNAINLVEVIATRLGPPRKQGASYKWRCPRVGFHEDKAPSLVVTPSYDTTRFKCFGCEWSGDVIDFLVEVEGLTRAAAIKALPSLAAEYPASGEQEIKSRRAPCRPRSRGRDLAALNEWRRAVDVVVSEGVRNLSARKDLIRGYKAALGYLTGPERLLRRQAIREARLGFNPAWRTLDLDVNGRPVKVPPGIIIPWYIGTAICDVKVRVFSGNDKYVRITKPPGMPKALYNYRLLANASTAVIVEGEFDAILGNQEAGDMAAFVTLGSASSDPGLFADRFKGKRVIVVADKDGPGKRAAEKWLEALETAGVPPRLIVVPIGRDLTEYALFGGDVRSWLKDVETFA